MHREVEKLLEELSMLCQTVLLGDQEWKRLYKIAVCMHTHDGLLDQKVVKQFLLEHGCSLQKAGFLSRQVLHLCTVLKLYDEQRSQTVRSKP